MNDFGKRLRELRKAAGLTQVELGRRAGVHSVTISRLEVGDHADPPLSVVARLVGALGVDYNALLAGGRKPPAPARRKRKGKET